LLVLDLLCHSNFVDDSPILTRYAVWIAKYLKHFREDGACFVGPGSQREVNHLTMEMNAL
jgi:hypothetical protein